MSIQQLSVHTLLEWINEKKPFILLDVREDHEVAYAHIPGHQHIPMHLLPIRHHELEDDKPIVVYCHHGMRSYQSGLYLHHLGFEDVFNLEGGIDAWSLNIDPTVPRY